MTTNLKFFSTLDDTRRSLEIHLTWNKRGMVLSQDEADEIVGKFRDKEPNYDEVIQFGDSQVFGRGFNNAETLYYQKFPDEIQVDN